MLYGLKHKPSGLYCRLAGKRVVADCTLNVNPQNILILPDLWTATQFVEKQLKGQPIEILELELREVRVIPPVIDANMEKEHERQQQENHQSNQLHRRNESPVSQGDVGTNGPVVP